MRFPGSNKLELNMAATSELIAAHLERSFSTQCIRVTQVEVSGSYGAKTLDVTFTTDPDPTAELVPQAAPMSRRDHVSPRPMPTNIADDNDPF